MNIKDLRKTLSDLKEIHYSYHQDIILLQEIRSRLEKRYSMLSELEDERHIGPVLDFTVDGIKSVTEASEKLYEAKVGVEKLIDRCQLFLEVTSK